MNSIANHFDGAAAKTLRKVDLDPQRDNAPKNASTQHEIGGLPKAGARDWLGTPAGTEKKYFSCLHIFLSDEEDEISVEESQATWYNTRANQKNRGPEYRLFYQSSSVTRRMQEGDLLLLAKHKSDTLLFLTAPAGSTSEMQLRRLFGLNVLDSEKFNAADLQTAEIPLPFRLALENLGVELHAPASDDGTWLERMEKEFDFQGNGFPTTAILSKFARTSLNDFLDKEIGPDSALLNWMEHEERLFRLLERELVKTRLSTGFGKNGQDVDEFIRYSLSVQNRRKSRVGHAFENHLEYIFKRQSLQFERGSKSKTTENQSKPDFLFPSFSAYHDTNYPTENLFLLGAKTTCKDRWRQVLSEGHKVKEKYLVTLEPAISENQTDEMKANNLTLVIPTTLHSTYSREQQKNLIDIQNFINFVKIKQEQE
jgi:hypothetical protein